MNNLFLAILVLVVAGCHTEHPLETPSGLPEVIIQGKSAQQIHQVVQDYFSRRGYVSKPTDHSDKMIFDRRTEKPGGKPLPSSCVRVRVVVMKLSNEVYRLLGLPLKVDDCDGDLESEHVMAGNYPDIQVILEEIKHSLGN
jgi:hypothetical protein